MDMYRGEKGHAVAELTGMYVVLLVASRVDVKPSVVERFEALVHFVYAYVVETVPA
jgi:hypothetical protein